MPVSRRLAIGLALVAVAAALAWFLLHRVDSSPIAVAPPELEEWTVVTSDGTDPWVVGMRPPDALVARLFAAASARAGTTLLPPPHQALPLVLRTEFDESLQGAFGIDSIQGMARDGGLDVGKAFEPVCLAHRRVTGSGGDAELYFVPFESAGFNQLRINLMPEHPEQAGIGIYDPSLLTPVLVVGATRNTFDEWWPLQFDRDRDCEAPLTGQ